MRNPPSLYQIILEVTHNHFKLWHVKNVRGGNVLSFCHIQSRKELDDKGMAALLGRLKSERFGEDRDVLLVLSRRNVIMQQGSFPSKDPQEIERMLNLQMPRQVPFHRDNMTIGYRILEQPREGYSKVLAAVAPKDVVQNLLRMVHGAGLQCHYVALSSQGIASWYRTRAGSAAGQAGTTTLVVNMDQFDAELCFCSGAGMMFSRRVDFGIRDAEAGDYRLLVEHIGLTLGVYKKEQFGTPVNRILIVAPQVALGDDMESRLAESFGLPVDLWHPLTDLPCERGFQVKAFWEQTVSMTEGVGFLNAGLEESFNLLPREVLQSKQQLRRKQLMLRCAGMAALTFVLLMLALGSNIYRRKVHLAAIKQEVKRIRPLMQKAEDNLKKLRFLQQKVQEHFYLAPIMEELYRIVPAKVGLRALELNEAGKLSLRGFAPSGTDVNQLQSHMIQSIVFRDVNLQFASKKWHGRKEYTDFKITAQVGNVQESQP